MHRILIFIVLLFSWVSCTSKKAPIKIGISHASMESGWGVLMYQEMENEFSLYYENNIQLVVKDAKRNNQKQVQDILDLYHEGVDVLIVFPFDSYAAVPVVEELYDKGLPIVLIDRKLNTSKYSVFVSSDNEMIGFEAGNYAANKLNYKGKVLEILGAKGSSTSMDRSKGFRKAVKEFPGIIVPRGIYGDWLANVTEQQVDSVFRSGYLPNLIYAHNDDMAQSAHHICEKYHIDPIIVGVDGLPHKNGGIDMVINKQIDATFYNYPGGDKAAQFAMSLVLKKKVPKDFILRTFAIDSSNAVSIKVGFEMQMEQFLKIRKQQQHIASMVGTIHSQYLLIYFSSAGILLLVLVVFIVIYFLKQKQRLIFLIEQQKKRIEQQVEEEKSLSDQLMKSNALLQRQSEEILQKNKFLEQYQNHLEMLIQERTKELEVALEKAKESDKLKTSFLSNLSHEIRTPLNSIMGFTDLLTNINFPQHEKENYRSIIIQSCNQLLNSITQIVDIAKLSTESVSFEKVLISTPQLFKELNNEMSSYIKLSLKNKSENVDFGFIDPIDVNIETDVFYIKQVISYLIDNALKFTNCGHVRVGFEIIGSSNARFFVNDTGIGIKRENLVIIFEKFRKIEDNNDILFRGIGLGLSISKQIVELLGGTISVKSEFGVGSEFSFIIPGIVQH